MDDGRVPELESAVAAVAAAHPDLRRTGGKKVFELRPDLDWDKGRAIAWLLEAQRLATPDVVPVYVGDDETDEDAFRALGPLDGVGVVVRGEGDARPTAADLALDDADAVRRLLDELARA